MAVFRTVIRSDLQKPLVVQQLSGNMFTADNASNEIAVEVTNGGEPVALSGAVTAYAVRADGVTAMFSGTISGNVASVILPATCYTKAGTLSIVVKVGTTTVGACTCYVYRTTTDEIVDPGHVIPSIDELLEQIEACRTATANANTAATNANTAASNANTKAALADEKATLADQKATLANTAAQNADTKAGLANDAATLANAKAGLANDAAALANTKAALADEKANLADAKANLADTAATNANTKAGLADTAAQNADAKATLANNAATLANTKAGLANTAATTANTAAGKIDNMTVAATGLPAGAAPVVTVTEVGGHKHIAFQIPKGDKGKDFRIAKTFASIAAMMAYTGTDLEKYDFAMIDTGSVEDPDTGKLYCYEPEKNPKWSYIGDLSGAQGIKGETGTGIDHVSLNADYTLTIYYDDGTSDTTASIRGATGITPNISIGSVTTLTPNQQAFVELDQTSTPEAPVFNFGIPKGDTGSVENVYGTTVPMSESDSTTVYDAIGGKLNKDQGTENAGKALGINNQGQVVPVPFSGEDFTGATPASAGTHGYVPAPQITDMTKFLCGDGTWADVAGGTLVTFELDEVTGTGGSYGHITYISSVTHDMKAVLIEVSDPEVFLDEISISCMDGGIALSCNNVNGTSTVTVSCLFKANPDNMTSSEFDVLSNRIGTLGNLKTTAKSNLVGAVNELYDDIAETKEDLEQTQDGLGIGADGDTHAAVASGQFVYVRNHETLSDGLYKANAAIAANGTLSTSNLTPDGSGGLNALKSNIDTLNSNKIDKPTSVPAGKYLQTDSNGNAVWGNAASPTDVANAVTNWLNDNIPTGQTVAVDQSLTVSGAAADAKVVGDDVADLKSALNALGLSVVDGKINITYEEDVA